jgi:uncharacterized protein (DUF2267 family)
LSTRSRLSWRRRYETRRIDRSGTGTSETEQRGDAERAIRSTLETLGERIRDGLAENLAGQLPVEIGEHLRRTEAIYDLGAGERFDRDEFIARVAGPSRRRPPTSPAWFLYL